MHAEFWHERWENNQIGFHERDINPLLIGYFPQLKLPKQSRIFVPLCGKTRDISWLLSQGYHVLGAELSELAITQLFNDLEINPSISTIGDILHYQGPQIDIFVGDIFKLDASLLGKIDGIYDRAALVALPSELRINYSAHLLSITQQAPQLLICFEYDQTLMAGPPFNVTRQEVRQHYGADYRIDVVYCEPLQGGLKGRTPANELVCLLTKNQEPTNAL